MKAKKLTIMHYIGILVLTLIVIGGVLVLTDVITPQEQSANKRVLVTTNVGQFELELFQDKAPNTVANFIKLADEGFYNGTRFHRVIANFMVQGGCPYSKDTTNMYAWGTGSPGYQFNCEIHNENKNLKGTISMANAGPNTNGSQFFINVANNDWLNRGHTVFGKVVSGMDVVLQMSNSATGQRDIPVEELIIESIKTDF